MLGQALDDRRSLMRESIRTPARARRTDPHATRAATSPLQSSASKLGGRGADGVCCGCASAPCALRCACGGATKCGKAGAARPPPACTQPAPASSRRFNARRRRLGSFLQFPPSLSLSLSLWRRLVAAGKRELLLLKRSGGAPADCAAAARTRRPRAGSMGTKRWPRNNCNFIITNIVTL
jgi:hypothetical protein